MLLDVVRRRYAQSDVVIIGAGAIDCSVAYHLGKRGMRATVVTAELIETGKPPLRAASR